MYSKGTNDDLFSKDFTYNYDIYKAEREGEVSDTAIETEATAIDTLLSMLEESDDPIQDCDDSVQRDGKCTGVSSVSDQAE